MKLPEILEKLGVPRRTLYSWMERHPNVKQADPNSPLGHPFPKPTHKEGRDNVWDDEAVEAWWQVNRPTIGRHPTERPVVIMPFASFRKAWETPPSVETYIDNDGKEQTIVEDHMRMVRDYRTHMDDVRITFDSIEDAIWFKLRFF